MAKVIRHRSSYLQSRETGWLVAAALLFVSSGALTIAFDTPVGFLPAALAVRPLYRYARYKAGRTGEQLVSESLEALDESYYVVHDVETRGGNIDHVVLGPNGVFVLETKHVTGHLGCRGDRWWRATARGRRAIRSPSLQAKRNAARVRERIQVFQDTVLKAYPAVHWVHALVVLSHPEVEVELRWPTVMVARVGELPSAISAVRSPTTLPSAALTKMALALLGMRGS